MVPLVHMEVSRVLRNGASRRLWVLIALACLGIGCSCMLASCAQTAGGEAVGDQGSAQSQDAGGQGSDEASEGEDAQGSDGGEGDAQPAEQVESEAPSVSIEEAEAIVGVSADGEGADYMPGEVLVTFVADVPADDVAQLLEQTPSVGDRMLTESSLVDATLEDGVLRAGTVDNPVVIVRTSEGATVVQAMAELQQSELVVDVQPNYIFTLDGE